MIRPDDLLLADGSNFRKWARRVRELASQVLSDEDFFTKASLNTQDEKIGRAILLRSVHPSLEDSLSLIASCFDIFNNIKTRFWAICRAAQIATFIRLIRVTPDSFSTTSAYAAEMRDIVADLKALNIQLTEDHILGLLLQLNLPAGEVKKELAQRVEHIMYNDPSHTTPSFDSLVTLLGVVRQQIHYSHLPDPLPSPAPVPVPPHMTFQAAAPDQPVDRFNPPEEEQQDPPSDVSANALHIQTRLFRLNITRTVL
ncbi:hypothetical protein MJO29_017034 [Puccinia striiformis f. sp. tritici]|nr:hypothetical protein MJO29_017034 [Puccinia striiformis f. sp. tritici]